MRCLFLVSGAGGDYLALERAKAQGLLAYESIRVIATNPDSAAYRHAEANGYSVQLWDASVLPRDVLTEGIRETFRETAFDLCILAGFRYLLPPDVVRAHRGKILNSHHSILPGNPGLYRKEKLVGSDNKLLGATVHLVDEGIDTGTIICQAAFPNYGMEAFENILAQYRRVQDLLMVTAFRIRCGHCFESRQPIVQDTVFWPAPEESDVHLFMENKEITS